MAEARKTRPRLAAALCAGLLGGLCGLDWGLPGPARWSVLPEGLKGSPAFASDLAARWEILYRDIERSHREMRSEEPKTYADKVLEIPAGWDSPPEALVNSARSFLVQSENPDEKKSFIILAQMRPWRLEVKPLYAQYGGAFIYPLGATLAAAAAVGAARLVPDLRAYLERPEDMGRLYLIGRLFVLAFHLGTLFLLFDLGRKLWNDEAGLCAALLYLLAPLSIANSHVLKPHPVAAFWALLALRRGLAAAAAGARKDHLLCGVWSGLAAGATLSFLPFTLLPAAAWAVGGRKSPRAALEGLAAAAFTVLAFNPHLFFAYRDFAWELEVYAPGRAWSLGALRGLPGAAASGLGGLVVLFGVLGAARALKRRDAPARLAALAFLGGALLLGLLLGRFWDFRQGVGLLRFYLPAAALCCLMAAGELCAGPWPRAWRLAALVLALAETGLRGLPYWANLHLGAGPLSTRLQAAEWLDAAAGPGVAVGLARLPEPAHCPPFRWDRHPLVILPESALETAAQRPDFFLVTDRERPALQGWLEKNYYEEAAVFPAWGSGWLRVKDESFFANAGLSIWEKPSLSSFPPTTSKTR